MNNIEMHSFLVKSSTDELKKVSTGAKNNPKYKGVTFEQLQLLQKIAKQTTPESFDQSLREKAIPAVKLSNSELEMLKGGIWWVLAGIAVMIINDYCSGDMGSAWDRGYAAGRGS